MSRHERVEFLNKVAWGDGPLTYVEGRKYPSLDEAVSRENITFGKLTSDTLSGWLRVEPPEPDIPSSSTTNSDQASYGPCTGSFRLLIVGSTAGSIAMTQQSFIDIETAFDLPGTQILHDLAYRAISQAYQAPVVSSASTGRLRLSLAHRGLLGASGVLALSYDEEKSATLALLVLYDEFTSTSSSPDILREIWDILKDLHSFWPHWICLPLMFQRHYYRRKRQLLAGRWDDVRNLEQQMEVTAGAEYVARGSLSENWPEHVDFKSLIVDTYVFSKETLIDQRVLDANKSALYFLLKTHADPRMACTFDTDGRQAVSDALYRELTLINGIDLELKSLEKNLSLLSGLVYNAINQRDSIVAQRYSRIAQEQTDLAQRNAELNIKIATSTKEDSISMLTFTFITALFLPGTFLSSFLSLTMINWDPGAGASSGQVTDQKPHMSSYYWVFWAIDIPLTLCVIFGWWFYWQHARRPWNKQMEARQDQLEQSMARDVHKNSKNGSGSRMPNHASFSAPVRRTRSRMLHTASRMGMD